MSFRKIFNAIEWDQVAESIVRKKDSDVERALGKKGKRDLDDLQALLSPAAAAYLEPMAALSQELTLKRFGKTMQMYIPLYLSNVCYSSCHYCGFKRENKVARVTLTAEQILEEVKVIKSYGFDHVLLVTGDMGKKGVQYLEDTIRLIRPYFSHISLEVQPASQEEYEAWIRQGLNTVLVYQETYHQQNYPKYHPSGPKADFNFRLDTADRLGKAGIHKIGLGALLGLENWRVDSWFVGLHLNYLENNYWQTKFSISFPRLRPATGIMEPNMVMSDRELVQVICAYRIFNENVELSLSTRESEHFRNHMIKLGITSVSAGSKTDPGGYSQAQEALEQFEIDDDRSPQEIAQMLQEQGYEAVWKDWDIHYGSQF